MSMVGNIKKKFEKFIDSRIINYFSKNKSVEKKAEDDIDVSMAEAENKREQNDLVKNLIYSIQRDFNSLRYIKEGKEYAFDSMDTCLKNNKMIGLTGSPKDIVFTFFTKFGYIGWQICSVLAQHWLVSNACSISNKDCLRNGWNNIFSDKKDKKETEEEEEKSQELLNRLFDIEQQKYSLNEKLLKWGYYYNVFGTAYMLPIIDGIDDKAREKPYNPDGIKKGSFKGISVIEPYWMIPEFDLETMTDPTNINFFEPEFYRTANGKKIHKSHLIIGRRKFVSDILKPSYYYGGISLAQEIYERVYASEKCANEAPLLLLTKRLNYYKVKLKDLILNPAKYKEIAETLTTMRDNQGILFADHQDEIGQIDTSLSDLDQIIMGQFKLVSAIARIPVDKLFETNPTGGLSASGDYNIKNYNQDLNTLQNDLFKPAIDRINEIVMRSEFERKDKVTIVFNPTDNPTEKEIAELNEKKAQTMAVYLQNGLITPEEARQKLVNDKMSGYSFLKGVELEEPTPEEQQDIEQMMNKEQEGKDEAISEDDRWVTLHPNENPDDYRRLLVEGEETVKEAIQRKYKGIGGKEVKEGEKPKATQVKEVRTGNTIQETETIGKELGLADTINYKGLDVAYANEVNKAIHKNLQQYPEVRDLMRTLGGARALRTERQKKYLEEHQQEIEDRINRRIENLMNYYKDFHGENMEKKINEVYGSIEKMKKQVRTKIVNSFRNVVSERINKNVWAWYRQSSMVIKDTNGIYFNDDWSFDKLNESLKKCVEQKYHPEGCDTVKSVIDHEFGHALTNFIVRRTYGLRATNKALEKIRSIRNSMSRQEIVDKLSRYGATNFDEFVAEAYSEYKNNSNPREVALQVGKLLEEAYKEAKNG